MEKIRAFTLIELLVVIAIIGLLMAILLPSMAMVRLQARDVACRSNLNQWGKVFMMYTNDNDGYFATGSTGKMWTTFLKPYYSDPQLQLCPMAKKAATEAGGEAAPFGSKLLAWGQFDETYEMFGLVGVSGSYGMNGHASNPTIGVVDPWGRDLGRNWTTPHVAQATDIPVFLDCIYIGAVPEQSDQPPMVDGYFEVTPFGVNMQGICIDRHNGTVNGLFADFGARDVGLKELWKLKWHREWDVNAEMPTWPVWMKNFRDY